jgi:hypothetical protein
MSSTPAENAPTHRASLPLIEQYLAQRNYEQALLCVLDVLDTIDRAYGELPSVETGILEGSDVNERALIICTRMASAIDRLVTDPAFKFSQHGFDRLLAHHRWVDLIFSVSGFRNASHLLPAIASNAESPNSWNFSGDRVLRLLAVFPTDSTMSLDFDQCWNAQKAAVATAFLNYIGSRYTFSDRAFDFRERLLEWLPGRLDEITLGTMIMSRVAEIYMHCSYAITPRKHAIKAALVRQIRQLCLKVGCKEMPPERVLEPLPERPTLVVICEHFSLGHSVFRTHSESVKALRERFHVIGFVAKHQISPAVEEIFDQVLPLGSEKSLEELSAEIMALNPSVLYYLGVGMASYAIAISSLRLAPLQIVSFGHGASTMNPMMDYFMMPEDCVGSTDRYSERVVALPKAAMPFKSMNYAENLRTAQPPNGPVLKIAIPATIMKINPRFLAALRRVSERAKTPHEFHLITGLARGISYQMLNNQVKRVLPNATVWSEVPFHDYMQRLTGFDFFLSPFPYGNMNSLVDAFHVGLPGICLDGPEPHEHIDAGLFARIGLPPELVAKSVDEYVAAIVRMIDDPAWRSQCQMIARFADLGAAFYEGDPGIFTRTVVGLLNDKLAESRAMLKLAQPAG